MKKMRGIIIFVVCAGLCVGYYFYLSNYSGEKESIPSEKAQLISKDLDSSYPTTPREVIKFYNRILLFLINLKKLTSQLDLAGTLQRDIRHRHHFRQTVERNRLILKRERN